MKHKKLSHQVQQHEDILTRLEKNPLFLKLFDLTIFLLPLFFYILTTGKTIVSFGDSDELATAAYTFDAAHPPGYPLFILLGKIFTFLPIGSIAFRVNVLSCVLGALTILVVTKLLRLFGVRPIIAGVSALAIAFSYSFWLYAIVSEVFMLNNFLAVSIIYCLLLFRKAVKEKKPDSHRKLYLTAFLTGLGFANHTSIVLLGPAMLYCILKTDKGILFRKFLPLLACFLLGLTPYLHLFFVSFTRHYPNFGNLPGLDRFFQYILRADYGGLFSAGAATGAETKSYWNLILYYGQLLLTRFTIIAPLFALSFLTRCLYKKDNERITLAILFLITAVVFPIYAFKGVDTDDLHVLGVAERLGQLGFLSFGILTILGILQTLSSFMQSKKYILIVSFFVIFSAISIAINFGSVNKNDYRLTHDYAKNILNQVEPDSIIITSDDLTFFALYYFINAEHVKPNVRLINPAFLSSKWYQRELRSYWPDLYVSDTQHPYAIQREIISLHHKKRPVYFVMLDDPYPLGFDGNPNYFLPQGLVLKADPNTTKESIKSASKNTSWEYDFSQAKKEYRDPFQKLAKKNITFRYEINAKVYLRADCLECAKKELARALLIDPNDLELRRKYETIAQIPAHPNLQTIEQYVASAKKFIQAKGYTFNLNIHRAIWDLERALQIDPTNEEVNGTLGELYEYVGAYKDSIRAYETAYKRNPEELEWQLRANTVKRKAPKRDVE